MGLFLTNKELTHVHTRSLGVQRDASIMVVVELGNSSLYLSPFVSFFSPGHIYTTGFDT